MIKVTKLNGNELVVNADLIEFVESTPDTLISLTTGRKIMVLEEMDEVAPNRQRAPTALAILAAMLVVMTFNLVPSVTAVLLAAIGQDSGEVDLARRTHIGGGKHAEPRPEPGRQLMALHLPEVIGRTHQQQRHRQPSKDPSRDPLICCRHGAVMHQRYMYRVEMREANRSRRR